MNKKICVECKRFVDRDEEKWYCAKKVWKECSTVIPGHYYYERDYLHLISNNIEKPPEWCELYMEQLIVEPEDEIEIMKKKKLRYDGNDTCEHNQKWKSNHGWNGQRRGI